MTERMTSADLRAAPPQRNGWFIWDAGWRGETAFRFLDRADARQGEMFA